MCGEGRVGMCTCMQCTCMRVCDLTNLFSFQVHFPSNFPSNPLQPGTIYFLTPRKCAVFGSQTDQLSVR